MSLRVQSATFPSDPTDALTIPVTFGTPVTTGNTIILALTWDISNSAAVSSIADGLGNTYTLVEKADDTTAQQTLAVYFAANITGGTCAPTATLSLAAGFRAAAATEYSGVTGWTLDRHAQLTNGTAATGANGMVGPAITPTTNGETIIAIGDHHQGATITPGTGYAQDANTGATAETLEIEHFDQGAAGAATSTWTVDTVGTFNAIILSLKPVVTSGNTASLASTGASTGATIAMTLGSAVTTGRTVVAAFTWDTAGGADISSVADGLGNTYVLIEKAADATNAQTLAVYVATNITGGTCTPTATLTVSTAFRAGAALELTGVNGYTVDRHAQLVDGTITTTGTDTMIGPTITPTSNGQTIVAIGDHHQGTIFTGGTGFTQDVTSGGTSETVQIEHRFQPTAAASTPTWSTTTTGTFNAVVLSLQPPATAPATNSATGFETGLPNVYTTVGSPTIIAGGAPGSGKFCARINPSAGQQQFAPLIPPSAAQWVGGFAVNATSVGTQAVHNLLTVGPGATNFPGLNLTTSLTIQATVSAGSETVVLTTPALTAGNWYWVDFALDATANPWVLKLRVQDMTAATILYDSSGTFTAAAVTTFTLGHLGNANPGNTCDYLLDDWIVSNTLGSYPLGPYAVLGLIPKTFDSTHSNNAGDFAWNSGTVNNQAMSSTAPGAIADTPWNTAVGTSSTYIKQTSLATAAGSPAQLGSNKLGHFVLAGSGGTGGGIPEIAMGLNWLSGSNANTPKLAWGWVEQYLESGSTAATTTCQVFAGGAAGTPTTLATGPVTSASTPTYMNGLLSPPAGGWSNAQLLATLVEWGQASSVVSQPCLANFMLEAAFQTTIVPQTWVPPVTRHRSPPILKRRRGHAIDFPWPQAPCIAVFVSHPTRPRLKSDGKQLKKSRVKWLPMTGVVAAPNPALVTRVPHARIKPQIRRRAHRFSPRWAQAPRLPPYIRYPTTAAIIAQNRTVAILNLPRLVAIQNNTRQAAIIKYTSLIGYQ